MSYAEPSAALRELFAIDDARIAAAQTADVTAFERICADEVSASPSALHLDE